jgi:hypothetical protein
MVLSLTATALAATSTETMLRLQAHCTEIDRTKCKEYDVLDATTLKTAEVKAGDILDIDVVLLTSTPEKVLAVRSWLNYDPNVLEVRNVELQPALANPIPGENMADSQNKIIKIGGGTDDKLKEKEAPLARITFNVKADTANTQISFAQFKADGTGLTGVLSNDSAMPSLLTTEPAKLMIVMKNGNSSPVGSSSSSSQTSMNTSSPQYSSSAQMSSSISTASLGSTSSMNSQYTESAGGTFTKLQVQNVKVTSNDTSLFVGWDPLPTPEIVGYNVYYGTISGRYIQRRTLNKDSNSLTIRGLESGVQYFISVRGVNGANEETAFSNEAAVVIGRPETSTAPLFNMQDDGPTGNPVEQHGGQIVAGESGMGEIVLLFLALSAMIGTAFAARRHYFSPEA